jgi:hypothetical protein
VTFGTISQAFLWIKAISVPISANFAASEEPNRNRRGERETGFLARPTLRPLSEFGEGSRMLEGKLGHGADCLVVARFIAPMRLVVPVSCCLDD